MGKLFKLIREVYESASRRITTGELNRFVENLQFEERKIYYITQHSIRPPAFACVHLQGRRWTPQGGSANRCGEIGFNREGSTPAESKLRI